MALTGRHPESGTVTDALTALGVHLDVQRSQCPGLTLVLDTPNGTITWQ